MARPRLGLVGAILLVFASLWLAPDTGVVRFEAGLSESGDALSARPLDGAHLPIAEALSDEPDDEGLGLDGRAAMTAPPAARSVRRGDSAGLGDRRTSPRATGPPA